MHPKSRRRLLPFILLLALSLFGFETCDGYGLGSPFLFFRTPLLMQVSLAEGVAVDLHVSELVDLDTLELALDGEVLDPALLETSPGEGGRSFFDPKKVETVLPALEDGVHWLSAQGTLDFFVFSVPLRALTRFDTVDLERPDECEILNAAHCALPFPSSRFVEDSADTATGRRLAFPVIEFEGVNGPPLDPTPLSRLDGYAPTAQIVVHLEGADLEASDAARLLAGQPQSPPYEGVRTHTDRSLDADSPTVLLDADTGERIMHWVELDQTPAALADPARQVLFIRPAVALEPDHRYVVAIRDMKDAAGERLPAEPVFRALVWGHPSTIPALEARREGMASILETLKSNGIGRRRLQLAFEFETRSEQQLHERMLAMRDESLGWLAGLAPEDVSGFQNLEVVDYGDCSDPAQITWRKVKGDFDGPNYMTGNIDNPFQLSVLNVDGDGMPVRNGTFPFAWSVAVPCSVYLGEESGHPLLLGHGFLGTGESMVQGFAAGGFFGSDPPVGYIAGATDWRGLSRGITGPDGLNILLNVIGTKAGGHRFNTFEALPHRLKQGMVNTLVLSRMMKSGFFNRLPELQRVPGDPASGVFTPDEEMFYFGVSLGGIYGTMYAGLNQDTIRHNVVVPAMNFSVLEQRSTQFPIFLQLIADVGLTDPMDLALLLGVQHELWASADPTGYIRNVTGTVDPPLPDTPAKKMLVTVAFLDKQVSNQAANIFTRSMGIPNLVGSVQHRLPGIPDVAADWADGDPGLDSAMQIFDSGYFDIFDPAYDAVVPALANIIPSSKCDPHGAPLATPAALDQVAAFLQPGGAVYNFCDGFCDADTVQDRPAGECNPLE